MKGNVKMFVSDKYQEKKNNPIKTHFLFFKRVADMPSVLQTSPRVTDGRKKG